MRCRIISREPADIPHRAAVHHTRGSALLLMIMLLAGIALTLLAVLSRFYRAEWHAVRDETAFYQADAGAASALEWGLTRRWPVSAEQGESPDNGLQCQTSPDPALKSCLLPLKGGLYLLQGSAFSVWFDRDYTHYRRVTAQRQHGALYLTPVPQGWSDFCPPALKKQCHRDVQGGEAENEDE